MLCISIHAPRGGSDWWFLRQADLELLHFNPRSPWGERHFPDRKLHSYNISIHAPRGGSDDLLEPEKEEHAYFNPRSPWGERRLTTYNFCGHRLFQSTLPVGGATLDALHSNVCFTYFNPRSPWGERPADKVVVEKPAVISIHAPRGGSDNFSRIAKIVTNNFNPRSPWGERHQKCHRSSGYLHISIHAPRGGSDAHVTSPSSSGINFNPRSPWGERPVDTLAIAMVVAFQSTLPVGGATQPRLLDSQKQAISIHAPRGGSDFFLTLYDYIIT